MWGVESRSLEVVVIFFLSEKGIGIGEGKNLMGYFKWVVSMGS